MKPDQSLEIQLSDHADQPVNLGNVVVEIHFFTGGRYRYAFKVGRTDDAGHLSISYREIERLRGENAVENLMDYNTKLEDCDPTIKIVVPSEGSCVSSMTVLCGAINSRRRGRLFGRRTGRC